MQFNSISKLLWNRISQNKIKNELVYKDKNAKWQNIRSDEFGKLILATAKALVDSGIDAGNTIAIYSQNMPEWTITDYAIQFIRGISVPIYPVLTTIQINYIINETEANIIFAGEQEQYEKALIVATTSPFIKKIVVFDNDVVLKDKSISVHFKDFIASTANSINNESILAKLEEIQPDDILTIIYTSGTTGDPKGVMLPHSAFTQIVKIHEIRLTFRVDDVSLCFLPLCHIFERGWTFLMLSKGITNYYLKNPKEIIDTIRKVKPTLMCTVPRFFDKTYAAVFNKLESFPTLKKKIFYWAIKTGQQLSENKRQEKIIPLSLKFRYFLADLLVLKKGRSVLGGKIRYMPCAGASLSDDVNKFFHAVGINVKYGYGLTETSATVSCFTDTDFIFGSVGLIMPEVEVRIGENNEILVKGKTVMKGYYKKPEETADVFEDGWFKTGDAGWIDSKDNLFMTERIKDIIKTSSGKFIAPQFIETVAGNDKYINQIAVTGNERKYISALIIPNLERLKEYAINSGIYFKNNKDLIENPDIVEFYLTRIGKLLKDLAPYEQIRKIRLIDKEFSIETGELTTTLKLKRKVIEEKYRDEIDSMY